MLRRPVQKRHDLRNILCLVADALGMNTVFAHPLGGVLSAYGMGLADQAEMRPQTVEKTLDESLMPELGAGLDALAGQAEAELRRQHVPQGDISVTRRVHHSRPSRAAFMNSSLARTVRFSFWYMIEA